MSVVPRKLRLILASVFLAFPWAMAAQTSPPPGSTSAPQGLKSQQDSPLSQSPRQHSARKVNASKQAKPAPQPMLPAGPLQPITLDQMPAAPPEVSYRAGQLTV